ncbi:MAG: hypothetical protein HGA45_12510 [Chloroflexales bacterium]|nr:hypothetical protein [Chloroflexales bacterium]
MVAQLASGQAVGLDSLGSVAEQLAQGIGPEQTRGQALGSLSGLYQSLADPALQGELIGPLLTPEAGRAISPLLSEAGGDNLASRIGPEVVARLQQIASLPSETARLRALLWLGVDQGALEPPPGPNDARGAAVIQALEASNISEVIALLPANPEERVALARTVAGSRDKLAIGLQALGRNAAPQAKDFFAEVYSPRAQRGSINGPEQRRQPEYGVEISQLSPVTLAGMLLAPDTAFGSLANSAGGYVRLQGRILGLIVGQLTPRR